jgi:hypothetical protein
VPWLSLVAASCVIDIFIQLLLFDGRVDGRSMQAALSTGKKNKSSNGELSDETNNDNEEDKLRALQQQYQGCIFDYSSDLKRDKDGGFWFDFMADCGDGFNSSYQVARMLAQPSIIARHNTMQKLLPRGQLLINGGDLAYPNPTAYRLVQCYSFF